MHEIVPKENLLQQVVFTWLKEKCISFDMEDAFRDENKQVIGSPKGFLSSKAAKNTHSSDKPRTGSLKIRARSQLKVNFIIIEKVFVDCRI